MKKNNNKSFVSIFRTIIELVKLSKQSRIWLFLKCINGALMAISWVVISRFIEYFTQAAINKDLDQFIKTTITYCILIVIMLVIRFMGPFMGNRQSMYKIRDLKRNLLFTIHKLKPHYFDEHHSGDVLTKLSSDINIVENFIDNDLATLLGYIPGGIIYGMIVVFKMNVELSLIVLPIVFITSMITMKFSFKIRKMSSERQKFVSNLNMILRDILENITITKIYNLNTFFFKKYDKQLKNAQQQENKIYKNRQIIGVIQGLIRIIPFTIAYLIGSIFVAKGQLTVSQLVAYGVLSSYMFGTFALLYIDIAHAAEVTGVMEHIKEIEQEEKERTDGNNYWDVTNDNAYTIRNLSFSYNRGIKVIDNVSFTIEKNKKTAIVGESGCGKSTIIKLLQGYYDDYEGEIFINGHSLSNWNLHKLRAQISCVTQAEYLFSDSIRKNIMLGNIIAGEKQFLKVCEMTGVDGIVSALDNGYDEQVGERGVSLSGGQKQRIHLARALLSNSQYLLLDEPTSNLDTKSEYYIEKAIKNYDKNKTIVIVAHRLSSIIDSDKIYVMKEGKIVEAGTHTQLMKKKGQYYNLYYMQEIK